MGSTNSVRVPDFDSDYKPKIENEVETSVTVMETNVDGVRNSTNADEADRGLDSACDGCITSFTCQVDGIRGDVKSRRGHIPEEQYLIFVQTVTAGIRRCQTLFGQMFEHIRNLIKVVIDWIRRRVAWVAQTVTDIFKKARSVWN